MFLVVFIYKLFWGKLLYVLDCKKWLIIFELLCIVGVYILWGGGDDD